MGRRLLQAAEVQDDSAGPPRILTVFNPGELQDAIEDGVEHIEIQQHMALSTLRLRELRDSELTAVLGGVPRSTLTIKARLSTGSETG